MPVRVLSKYLAPPLIGVEDVIIDDATGRVGYSRRINERGEDKIIHEFIFENEKEAAKELYKL